MKIYTYASLKDYFDKEFVVEEPLATVEELNNFLARRNPAAIAILSSSRYAVQDSFVGNDFSLNKEDHIHIMPPSSGG